MYNLNDMMVFMAVAEHGNFTKAAARLGMPKSTVSKRVSELEARLGLRLLNRSTRLVSITANGQVFLTYCHQIRNEANSSEIAMSKLREQPMGRLRITCPEIIATYFMPDLVHEFGKSFPDVEIEVIATNAYVDLIQEQIDFAIRVGELADSEIIEQHIAPLRRILVASPTYIARYGAPIVPEDLLIHQCLVHTSLKSWCLHKRTKTFELAPKTRLSSDNIGFLLQSCLRGEGIAILPAYICTQHLQRGELKPLLVDWNVPDNHFYLLYPSRRDVSRAQTVFKTFLQSYDVSVLSAP